MEASLLSKLESIRISLSYAVPEIILATGIFLSIFIGFFFRKRKTVVHALVACGIAAGSLAYTIFCWPVFVTPVSLFAQLLQSDSFSSYFKILIDTGGLLTILMSMRNPETTSNKFNAEYYALILSALLGAHVLTMSTNLIMVFISLELLSISSYVLAGYSFSKKGAEGSLKYFLFGSTASAIMLYGFSILFGITGSLNFTSAEFTARLVEEHQSMLLVVASMMALAGFLYKIAAAPMHIWSPDVYEASPMPVVGFLSVVPKLAGMVILSRFTFAINLSTGISPDWQWVLSVLAIITIGVGNFSAVWQKNPKRMIAYSSIAQAGFLLIAVTCFSAQGIGALLFYSTVYLLSNFAVVIILQAFEKNGIHTIPEFKGLGKSFLWGTVLILVALISLSGIPPTGGFTSKLFLFASLWSSYEQTGKEILIGLLVFGLLNTVVSLFYYLKIPYYAFIKPQETAINPQKTVFENFLAFILVVGILLLFIRPDVLMGWLNTLNFVS